MSISMPLNFAVVAFIVTLTWMKFEQQFRPGMLLLRTTVFFATLTIRIFIYLFNEWQCRSRIWYTWWVCISKRLKKKPNKIIRKKQFARNAYTTYMCFELHSAAPPFKHPLTPILSRFIFAYEMFGKFPDFIFQGHR